MNIQRKTAFWLIFILFYTTFYFGWLLNWKSNEGILTLGGNILSVGAGAVATTWLLFSAQKSMQSDKPFWLLLAAGAYSNFLAEFFWLTYENLLKLEVPYPGLPDLFYLLQVVFYLAAFVYKVTKEKKQYHFITFIFDILIIMTVASTFSWHFLLQPIIAISQVSAFSLVVSLAYPVGDLALLFGTLFLMSQFLYSKTIIVLFFGLLTQVTADSSYLYLVSSDSYLSGSFIDPLFTLAVLLIGFTGLIDKEAKVKEQEPPLPQSSNQLLNILRIAFPYLNVTVLFVFMVLRSTGIDVVTIGSAISILLVIIRQIFVLTENQKLLHQVLDKKEALETDGNREESSARFSEVYAKNAEDTSAALPEFHESPTKIQFLAYHDSLTGLANRALFEATLNQAVSNAQLHNQFFAVMFLDLDNFKKVNDTMGHDAGDQLLVLIANRLKECIRKNDLVARLGGDEFTFLIRDVFSPQDAAFIAEKIIRSLSQPYVIDGEEISSSPSIGIALYPLNGTTPAALLKKADVAMYQVKENGKGHYRLSETEDTVLIGNKSTRNIKERQR
ncbi:diguanylate cyclase domain-containing protein [Planomicrobium sp. CPCC 101079]|uniref:diguanylate cyclase domain-containing protein n=1 Tax=Planomicrobium sp. CPCC 101079 TaxID=2599618 RepID=UPI0011B4D4F3|nr:diguanylate cyclase [Planomicrobium sp. CPCC 101079]TWT13210.1 diguanylate cyclase [Planomicrobium sp. CPCC 101079]